ncbi:MAG: transglutaminase-like domain-containing protein [Candidatus Aegiribacteria sp.]|nr:transglutaminase-like domain-containing protein [Candidatus Aegiribacteria sp.]
MKHEKTIIVILLLILPVFISGCGNGTSEGGSRNSDLYVTDADASTQKFAVSIQGDDVGYMQLDIEDHGTDSLMITQTINWNMILMGNRRDIEMSMTAVSDREYNLGRMEMHMSDGSSNITISAYRRDSLLISEIGTAGRVIENSTVIEGDYLPVLADLACASMEWTEGQERTFQSFDPASGMILSSTAVCSGFEEVSLLGDTVNAARLRLSQMGTRNTVWVFEGQIIRELEEGLGMDMTRVPPSQGGDIVATRDLYEVFAVSSTPISNPRSTVQRTFVLQGDIDWSLFQLNIPPVQTAFESTVTISNCVPIDIVSYPPVVPEELVAFTQPEPMIQSDDSVIMEKAASLTDGCTDAWEAARRIASFVDTSVENSPTVSLPSAVDVMENLRGDCNEHTILTVALARAAGLPARICAGIVYLNGSFGYHAWPMIWVGEWVEMDPTFSQYIADGTHIILAVGDLESQYVVNSAIGRLSIVELEMD